MSSVRGVNVGGNLFGVTDSTNIAPIETTNFATRGYAKDRCFIMVDGLLYRATTEIESGDPIVINGNCKRTTLDEIISVIETDSDLIAPTEDGATSSDDYAVGDEIVRSGILYKVISAITQGDAFAIGSNIDIAGSLTSQIKTLTNQVATKADRTALMNVEGAIAPIENGTNYSTEYSKGTQFMRNNMLYEVTASSVNSSTAINTGTGGNAKLAKVIVDQIASNRTIIDGTFSTYYAASQQWKTLAELTVPSDGAYLLVANARSETSIANKTMSLRIVKKSDGGTLCGQISQIDASAGANCCIILNATANQTYAYNVYNSADSQIRIDNALFRAFRLL